MARDSGPLEHHLSERALERRINEESDADVQQRLVFIRHLYRGDDIERAAKLVGTDAHTGRRWLTHWNEYGLDGLTPSVETTDQSLPPGTQATVEYLNYEVLDEYGWELDDDDLFETAADAGLDDDDHGTIVVDGDEYILEAAEAQGLTWPYSCRGGACANCAAILKAGEIDIATQQILPDAAIQEEHVRLTCIGSPATEDIRIVYNAKHEDYLQELVLPPQESQHTEENASGWQTWLRSLLNR